MDQELQRIAASAATVVVSAMATDAWSQVRVSLGRLWTRLRPDTVETVVAALERDEASVAAARRVGDQAGEAAVRSSWDDRFVALLARNPDAQAEVEDLLRRHRPDLASSATAGTTNSARAGKGATVVQAGRDANITGWR
jgi:hypothetical protein